MVEFHFVVVTVIAIDVFERDRFRAVCGIVGIFDDTTSNRDCLSL